MGMLTGLSVVVLGNGPELQLKSRRQETRDQSIGGLIVTPFLPRSTFPHNIKTKTLEPPALPNDRPSPHSQTSAMSQSKRSLQWDDPSRARQFSNRGRPPKRAKTSSTQPSSSQSSSQGYNSRQPILIDSDDDDVFNEIFTQSQPVEVDDYVSLGYIGGAL
jgi:hypothetical protein